MKKQAIPFLLLTILLLALAALRALTYLDAPLRPGEAMVKNRPVEVLENGYVSSRTCEACHPHEHATWHSSYHRTMTQVATPETVLGEKSIGTTGHFDGTVKTCLGKDYRLGRDGDQLWVELPWDWGVEWISQAPIKLTLFEVTEAGNSAGTPARVLANQEAGGKGSVAVKKSGRYFINVETPGKWVIKIRKGPAGREAAAGLNFRGEGNGRTNPFVVKNEEPDRREIVMTTGSHHMQAYWYATGDHRKVGLLPLVYLNLENDQAWVPEFSTFLHDPDNLRAYKAEGRWNQACYQCHATASQPRLDRTEFDMDWEIKWDSQGPFKLSLFKTDESGKGTLAGILTEQEQGGGGSSKQQKAGTYYLEVETEGKWAIGVRRQSDFLETVARANFRGEGAQKTRPFIMKAIDTKVAELGIACEACHGPASEHVKINRDPARRYKQHLGEDLPDTTIQNPARMKPKEASQVCGQCHSVWYESLEEDKAKKESGYTYRPGDDLSKTREVVNREDMNTETIRDISKSEPHYLADRYWSDGMIRIAGREYSGLIDSPCYTHGDPDPKKTITCMSCHTMHKSKGSADSIRQWKDDQLGEGMRGNQACLQCHEEIGAKLAEHTHHLPDSSGSECYNCHMPHTTYGLLKGIRSHTISTPSVQESVQVGRPNACNACHLDQTLHWTAGHLQSWYGIEPPELKDEQKEIAASILWALTGDAGQRALMAWAMGWKPAQEASGTDWMLPFLVPLFEGDPYHAVRYIAQRSIRSLDSQYKYLDFEKASFMKLAVDREQMRRDVVGLWEQQARAPETKRKELLFDQAGKLDKNRWSQLVRRRNNQRVNLEE